MKNNTKIDEGKEYIKSFPEFRKWINECPLCHNIGYKSSMPDHVGGPNSFAGSFIRKYFKEFDLEDNGFCSTCNMILNKKSERLSYQKFISDLNSYKIKEFTFKIKDYAHYRNCKIELDSTSNIKSIIVNLTPDKSEYYNFFKNFKENYKLFRIKNMKYTLKQVWDRIEIKSITYAD